MSGQYFIESAIVLLIIGGYCNVREILGVNYNNV